MPLPKEKRLDSEVAWLVIYLARDTIYRSNLSLDLKDQAIKFTELEN